MLFSEPKIPQSGGWSTNAVRGKYGFSALQRAENSSISVFATGLATGVCFSALQRAENSSMAITPECDIYEPPSFSALQRAENSSIDAADGITAGGRRSVSVLFSEPKIPQSMRRSSIPGAALSFSALQRAENSSIGRPGVAGAVPFRVSVLFSEPKIPQSGYRLDADAHRQGFSALQRAENSSIFRNRCVVAH